MLLPRSAETGRKTNTLHRPIRSERRKGGRERGEKERKQHVKLKS